MILKTTLSELDIKATLILGMGAGQMQFKPTFVPCTQVSCTQFVAILGMLSWLWT